MRFTMTTCCAIAMLLSCANTRHNGVDAGDPIGLNKVLAARGAAFLGDHDGDGDVDLDDFAKFVSCFNGSGQPYGNADCDLFDEDSDGDVDLNDFAVFQVCFTGPARESMRAACYRGDGRPVAFNGSVTVREGESVTITLRAQQPSGGGT